MLALILISALTVVFSIQLVKATGGAIYIRADGSVDPPDAPIRRDGNLYTFTTDIYGSIVVERDNIVIDGAGYTLQGIVRISSIGIALFERTNVTIKNTQISGFHFGIYLNYSSNNNINKNKITKNDFGIYLEDSSYNSVNENNVAANDRNGIYLNYSSNCNSICGNNIANNDIDGVQLDYSSNNKISENNVIDNKDDGIELYYSSNNEISKNNVTASNGFGISLVYASDNIIGGNNIRANNVIGICFSDSSNNSISENDIRGSLFGIWLGGSSDNNIINGNNITANDGGGIMLGSSSNIICGNNIVNNGYDGGYGGILLCDYTSNNKFYHNNFINNNKMQVYNYESSTNVWDDGYPSGGNYWSDYAGVDADGDGIGDTPYVIDADNRDRYPLMKPWSPGSIKKEVRFRGTVTGFPDFGGAVGVGGINVRIDEIFDDPTLKLEIGDIATVTWAIYPYPPCPEEEFAVGDRVDVCGYYETGEKPNWWSETGEHWIYLETSNHYIRKVETTIVNSLALRYLKDGETYRILNVKVGEDPYYVVLYFPSSEKNPKVKDFTGAVVIDATDLEPLVATENPRKNFIVNSSITLALAKYGDWVTVDPNYWADLNLYAKAGYVSLLVTYGGVQALWFTIDFATGGVSAFDIALRMDEIAGFALEQIEALTKVGGVADEVQKGVSWVSFAKDQYEGFDALKSVYLAYAAKNSLTSEELIKYYDQLAFTKTKTSLLNFAEAVVDYSFTDDIGGMATTMLEVGEYTKMLEGISRHILTVVHAIADDTATPPQIYALLDSQVDSAFFALRTWSAMKNMYQNIVNRGVFSVWYWLMDAPNSLKHYQGLYRNWLPILEERSKQKEDFYDAVDRLFTQSVQRVVSGDPPNSLNVYLASDISASLLMLACAVSICSRKRLRRLRKLSGGGHY